MSQTQGIVDQTTNAQIDTLILDNRKKLNQIIGMVIHHSNASLAFNYVF